MTKFTIVSSETIYYENDVEAATEEEARKMITEGDIELEERNTYGWQIDKIWNADAVIPGGVPLTDEDEDDIDPNGWYVVSSQGVEDGPWDTRAKAQAECKDVCYRPMIGEEVQEMLNC